MKYAKFIKAVKNNNGSVMVKIIKCNNPNAWYVDKIGQEFELCSWAMDAGKLKSEKSKHILLEDCEII